MEYGEFLKVVVLGIIAMLRAITLINVVPNFITGAEDKKEQCEKDLPRSQHCVTIYVPEDSSHASLP